MSGQVFTEDARTFAALFWLRSGWAPWGYQVGWPQHGEQHCISKCGEDEWIMCCGHVFTDAEISDATARGLMCKVTDDHGREARIYGPTAEQWLSSVWDQFSKTLGPDPWPEDDGNSRPPPSPEVEMNADKTQGAQ